MEFDKLNAELASLYAEKLDSEIASSLDVMVEPIKKPEPVILHTDLADGCWSEVNEMLTTLWDDETGSAGQALVSNGAGATPTWENYYFNCTVSVNTAEMTVTSSSDEMDHIVSSLNKTNLSTSATPSFYYLDTEYQYALQVVGENGNLIVAIDNKTGEVTLGKDVSPEFAAHEFWHRLAEVGGNFGQRLEDLQSELVEIEQELSDEHDMRLELEEIVNDIANALGIPQATEYDIADYAATLKARVDAVDTNREASYKRSMEIGTKLLEKYKEEDPTVAYERAMKIVR